MLTQHTIYSRGDASYRWELQFIDIVPTLPNAQANPEGSSLGSKKPPFRLNITEKWVWLSRKWEWFSKIRQKDKFFKKTHHRLILAPETDPTEGGGNFSLEALWHKILKGENPHPALYHNGW